MNGEGSGARDVGRGVFAGDAEALVMRGGLVAEDAGKEAGDGVYDHGGSEFAAGEDEVADRNLAVSEEIVDALVYAFVAAAEQDDAFGAGEFMGDRLSEALALGGEQDDGFALRIAFSQRSDTEGLDGSEERFGFEDHAFSATEGTVVHGAMFVFGPGAEVVEVDGGFAGVEGALEDSEAEGAIEELGKDGDDIEAQAHEDFSGLAADFGEG